MWGWGARGRESGSRPGWSGSGAGAGAREKGGDKVGRRFRASMAGYIYMPVAGSSFSTVASIDSLKVAAAWKQRGRESVSKRASETGTSRGPAVAEERSAGCGGRQRGGSGAALYRSEVGDTPRSRPRRSLPPRRPPPASCQWHSGSSARRGCRGAPPTCHAPGCTPPPQRGSAGRCTAGCPLCHSHPPEAEAAVQGCN